jgi:multiple sugar transport system ATP-binding protein
VEAMTLGQRVAVMREGRIQQVDTPQALYAAPANLFVAAFIGSPAMNLVEADVEDGAVRFAGFSLPVTTPARGRVIVGIRPEAFADASLADSSLPHLEVDVEVVEELGAETHVIFPVDAAPVDVSGARESDGEQMLIADTRSTFTARLDPRTAARPGRPLRLAVDPTRFHFFDPATGDRLARDAAPALARA